MFKLVILAGTEQYGEQFDQSNKKSEQTVFKINNSRLTSISIMERSTITSIF